MESTQDQPLDSRSAFALAARELQESRDVMVALGEIIGGFTFDDDPNVARSAAVLRGAISGIESAMLTAWGTASMMDRDDG